MIPKIGGLFLFFWDMVSLCSPGYPGTHFVDQVGLELRDLPASVFISCVWNSDRPDTLLGNRYTGRELRRETTWERKDTMGRGEETQGRLMRRIRATSCYTRVKMSQQYFTCLPKTCRPDTVNITKTNKSLINVKKSISQYHRIGSWGCLGH